MSEIFVFGSNLQGIHGKGAALEAVDKHGAKWRQGVGIQGSSYAIPTKRTPWVQLHLDVIKTHVLDFIAYATMREDLTFRLTPIGCGLAGYKPEQIAPMFRGSPPNVIVPEEFKRILCGATP